MFKAGVISKLMNMQDNLKTNIWNKQADIDCLLL